MNLAQQTAINPDIVLSDDAVSGFADSARTDTEAGL